MKGYRTKRTVAIAYFHASNHRSCPISVLPPGGQRHRLSHPLTWRRWLNGIVWLGRRAGQQHPIFPLLEDSFALPCEFFFSTHNTHTQTEKRPDYQLFDFLIFFNSGRQSSGKGCRTEISPQLLHRAPPFPLSAKGIAWDLGVLCKANSSHRCRRSGPVGTCEGNLESPRERDHRAFGSMMLMIHRVGAFVLVWIKFGMRSRSWRRSPGNVRIDITSRTGVLGLCGGEHTLHGLRWRGSDDVKT